ncbi:MAG: hypothetical protein D6702_06455 [Planctomycetota bacterium]|nr:MAG: hypothetical protein D6702_06455 [Planctomycetota bacterium]
MNRLHRPLRLAATAGLALTITLACARGLKDTPVQSWWEGFGPVIPHDKFPADCQLCHTGQGWHEIKADFSFDHAAETGYELEGAHAQAQCLRCHNDRGPAADFAARGCAGCHEDVHLGQLGQDCELCHGKENWQPQGQIAQHQQTRFPLVGAHAAAPCRSCHPAAEIGVFVPADTECLSCHADNLAAAKSPDHLAQGWTDGCDRCHIPTAWTGAAFNHGWWPLTGAHAAAKCADCHGGGVYAGTDPNCFSCHATEYGGTTDPDHAALGLPTACRQCHTTRGWKPANMNHSGLSGACVDCHLDDYLNTTSPDHQAQGYPTTCQDCHDTQNWNNAVFDHGGINSGCVSCHLAEYQATTDPDHQAMGFPTTCEDCHDTKNWAHGTFDHNGIVDNCVSCHLAEYQATTNPNHQAAGFPTTCEDCHDTVNWNHGTFDHDFPITSGKHKGFACAKCHKNTANYADFTCIDCHAHRKSKMDDEHRDVNGYVYASPACYSCHPNGKAD